jgi:hypothetical protein
MDNPAHQQLLTRAIAAGGTDTIAIVTAALWSTTVGLFLIHLTPHHVFRTVQQFDVSECLLLGVGALGFQAATLRLCLDQVADIWPAAIDGSRPHLPLRRWRAFAVVGAASWLAALAIGAPVILGLWHPDTTDLIFALAIVTTPAIQCSGAAVAGRIIIHALHERETASEARLRIDLAAHLTIPKQSPQV